MSRDFSAYQRAVDRIAAREERRDRDKSSNDFTWLTTNKPAKKNEQTRMNLRVVPRPNPNGGEFEEFWVEIDQHMVFVEGKLRAFVCPDNHDDPSAPKVCPMCKLSRELYSTREPEHLGAAKEASARARVFCNVIDLDDTDHPDSPKVWGFSRAVHHSILDICMAKRSFIEDMESGRDLILTTRRIGPKKVDIRYAVTDMDSKPLGEEWRAIAANAHDLEGLAKPANIDELAEAAATIDPRKGSKRGTYTPTPTGGDWSKPAQAAPAPPKRAPAAPEAPWASEAKWSYIAPSGEQTDGLGHAQIVALIEGAPAADHLVWREGQADWAPTSKLSEFEEAHAKLAAAPSAGGPPAPPSAGGPPAPPNPRAGKAF